MNKLLTRDSKLRLLAQAGQRVLLRRSLVAIACRMKGESPDRRLQDTRKNEIRPSSFGSGKYSSS